MRPSLVLLRAAVPAALLLVAPHARAQGGSTVSWVRDSLDSKVLHERRTLLISTPPTYPLGIDSFPVLVLLDADDAAQFTAAVANARFLASRSEIPQLLIVGVTNGKDRTHDMTPAASGSSATQFPTAGGAVAFENFIAGEVLPYIRGKYRTRPATVLAGHSFGGLFAVDVAATMKNPYVGFIAMSPSLWWSDTSLVNPYADGIARLTTGQRLFATSGGLEPPIDGSTRAFVARLGADRPKSVTYGYLHLPDDTHGLTPEPSLVAGLRFIFQPVAISRLPLSQLGPGSDSAAIVNMVMQTESTYGAGARSLSLPDKLPEPILNSLGYTVLQALNRPAVAAWIFSRNAAAWPGSPNVHDSYGDGLLARGDTTAAIAEFRKAVELGEPRHDPVVPVSKAKLEKLEKRISG